MNGQPTIYISGGIANLKPDNVTAMFFAVQRELERLGCKVLSPIRGKKIDAECDQRYEPNEIVNRDLWDIANSDLMIAIPSDISIGTYMELFFAAHVRHIPVITVATGRIAKHYWIKHFSSKILPTCSDAIAYLKDWYL